MKQNLFLPFFGGVSLIDTAKNILKSKTIALLTAAGLSITVSAVKAQAPTLSYSSPVNYTGTAITPSSSGVSTRSYGAAITLAAGFTDPRGITLDASGNIYVADYGANSIKKVPAGGGTPIIIASLNKPLSVAVDAAGNIYAGGVDDASAYGIIIKVPAGGGAASRIYTSTTAYGVTGLIFGDDGSLYGCSDGLFRLSPGTYTRTLIYNGIFISMVLDNEGNIYGLPSTYTGNTGFITEINIKERRVVNSNIPVTYAQDIVIDAANNMYISQLHGFAMYPSANNPSPDFGLGQDTYRGVRIDAAGNIFVADATTKTLKEIKPTGGYYIDKFLPLSLTFNNNTGVIAGSPRVTAAAKDYVITAYNSNGSASANLNLRIDQPALPSFSYHSPNTFITGQTISALTPSGTSLNAPYYSTVLDTVKTGTGLGNGLTQGGNTDAAGNIYQINSDINNNTYKLVKTSPNGSSAVISTFYDPIISLLADPQGNVYVLRYNDNIGKNYLTKIFAGVYNDSILFSSRNVTSFAVDASGNLFANCADSRYDEYYDRYFNDLALLMLGTDGNTQQLSINRFGSAAKVLLDTVGQVYIINDDGNKLLRFKTLGGYFLNKMLPAGLSLNNTTGIISGTPTTAKPATTYTITGYNLAGSGSASTSIRVMQADSAGLSSLTISSGTLNPTFIQDQTTYNVSVPNSITSETLVPVSTINGATVTVNGQPVTSGSPSQVVNLNEGSNVINVAVTSPDGTKNKTYAINVVRATSTPANANLFDVALSSGILSPSFSATTANYTAAVDFGTTSIMLTPTLSAAAATVTVNGVTVNSGNASGSLPLAVGANVITTRVTSQNGTVKTYKVTVTRHAEPDAKLTGLAVSSGTLTPAFASGTATYSVSVANAVSVINVTPTASQSDAVIKVNGTTVASGSASPYMSLAIGNNTIQVVVTAVDGTTTSTYTINVSRPVSSNANLAGIVVSNGTLSPTFAAGTTVYTNTVSAATQSVTITPTVSEANATVTVNGVAVPSGTASAAINTPSNTTTLATLKVTAQDGTTVKTYKVNVVRPAASNDANLANFTVSNGTLTPAFSPATTSYATTVTNAISLYQVIPTVNYPTATVTVNGMAVASGSQSQVIPLIVGDNTITTVVTAEDGTTLRTYTLVVTRQISTNANLANLGISGGTLSPAFAAATVAYTSTVNTATITVTPTVSEANATVTVNGTAVPSGTASGPVSLAVGSNVITVKVTAQNGTTVKTYKITVTRPAPSSNANLASLTVNTGTLTPAFDPSVTAYTIDVPTTTTTIKITGAIPADTNAVVRINGAKGQVSPYLQLNPGANTITVSVTAQDGSTVKTYTITVNRALDTNNYLSSLELYTGSYSPSFTSTGTSYTQSLPYTTTQTTIVIRPSSYSASLTINGQSVPFTSTIEGGQPVKIYQKVYALAFGANVFNILVTAESGATRTITVTINRAGPPINNNANLGNLTVSPGTLTPAFLKTTTNYAVTVPYGTGFVTVTPTTDNQYAHVTVNGSEVAYGNSTTVLTTTGANLITFRVTATDSTTVKTYKLTVTVQPPANNANLSNLTIGTGTLTPSFAPATTSYSVSVPYNTASISVHPTLSDSHGTVAPAGNFTINPPVGTSTTNIVVTAQDGVTKKTYSLTVTRAGSANANLANLDIDAGTLTPAFSSSTTSYTASVANSVTQIGTTALTSEANATISVNGGAATTRTSSVMVNLNVGINVITTKVTAQDGTTVKTYKITVTRAAGASGFGNNTSISYANTESYTPDGSDVAVQQAMSPNGDGLNDRLQIDGIESHPDNKLTIIDRNGTLVYEITGYDNDAKVFDGHSNKTGKLQLPGTYYYVLDYKTGDETKHKTGYLIIKY